MSIEKGLTIGGDVNGSGLEGSFRPGVGTLAAPIVAGAAATVSGLIFSFYIW